MPLSALLVVGAMCEPLYSRLPEFTRQTSLEVTLTRDHPDLNQRLEREVHRRLGQLNGRITEYVDHLLEPCRTVRGRYVAPRAAGYSTEMKSASLEDYEFPNGSIWSKA